MENDHVLFELLQKGFSRIKKISRKLLKRNKPFVYYLSPGRYGFAFQFKNQWYIGQHCCLKYDKSAVLEQNKLTQSWAVPYFYTGKEF